MDFGKIESFVWVLHFFFKVERLGNTKSKGSFFGRRRRKEFDEKKTWRISRRRRGGLERINKPIIPFKKIASFFFFFLSTTYLFFNWSS